MRPPSVVIATSVVATVLAVVVLWPGGTEPSRAQPPPSADISGAGIHLTASVDNVRVDPPGDRTPTYLMTFAHAAQLSGDYSLSVEGAAVTSGQAVAGFVLGCAISVDNGFTVGIDPNQGLLASISPEFSPANVAARLPIATFAPVPTTPSVTPTPVPRPIATPTPVPTTPSATPTQVSTTPSVTPTQVPTPSASTASRSAAAASRSAAAASQSAAATSQSAATTSQSAAATSPSIETTSPSIETTTPSIETTIPSIETTTPSASPPSASLGPTVGGTLGLAEVLEATLAPGQITTVTTVTANLDDKTVFPYHFIFNNAALNVGQCASPVSAVPFITASVGTPVGITQTTAYGSQFVF
ncbi:MspA family porin [Nocardia sp. NPDC050412]|uniref:MspA family porin n=1 Tax=unclassified Nocardia TaxID=2637762 RepID=UPI003792838C